jgi:hypothetical protein
MSSGRYKWLVGGLVVAAAIVFAVGVAATDLNKPDDAPQSEVVEHFIPEPDAEVLRQAELGIDLAVGYEGTLAVNGVDIPEEEQRLVPQENQMFFTPGEGQSVERLLAGRNCVTATVWKSSEGADTPNKRSFSWCFEAT